MATYFICSACGSDLRFACEVYKIDRTALDPDELMVPTSKIGSQTQYKRIIYKSAFVDPNFCHDSIARQSQWSRVFGNATGDRFHINLGRYSIIKYLSNIVLPSDVIIIGSAIYTAGLVRGTFMPIDQYEKELVDLCYKLNVYFTGNDFGPELKQNVLSKRIESVPLSKKMITATDLTGWVNS